MSESASLSSPVVRVQGETAEPFAIRQREVLELMAGGAPFVQVLERIVLMVESQARDMTCSILLLDREQNCLRMGVAPHLPAEYNELLDGAKIGPNAGSCGAAAYRGERVIVENITTHPNWEHYRDWALPHGLRACWSTPIFSTKGEVLGTFAMYHQTFRGPKPAEVHWVDEAAHLAAIAIEKHRSETALRQSESQFLAIMDHSPALVFMKDLEGRYLFVNRLFERRYGFTREQVLGKTDEDLFSPVQAEAFRQSDLEMLAYGGPLNCEELAEFDTGLHTCIVNKFPLRDAAGRIYALCGIVTDITEHRKAEQQIASQAALLDKAKDAILVRGLNGVVSYWNRSAERLYGWTEKEAIGSNLAELIHRDLTAFLAAQQELMEKDEWSGELIQYTKAGEEIIVEGTWTLLRDARGRPKSVLTINTDITAKKRLEAQFLAAQRMESIGTLAGGIAHDFNNVLTGILNYTELARRVPDCPPRVQAMLAEVSKAGGRASDLVRQILTFSRQQPQKRRPLRMRPIIEEVLKLLRPTFPSSIEITVDLSEDAPVILADPTCLHQVMMNLCTNAVHAVGQQPGRITVSLAPVLIEAAPFPEAPEAAPGVYARLTVADTGKGMDAVTCARIFEPFFTSKAPGEGTGLGLSVVHGIMRDHDGTITVESEPGVGTTFRLYFPAHAAEPVDEGAQTLSPPPRGDHQRILFVDDEELICEIGEMLLSTLGYRVETCAEPEKARVRFAADPSAYDLVITDLNMPGMTGIDLVKQLRALRREIPILLISGYSGIWTLDKLREHGVAAMLPKPFNQYSLSKAVHGIFHPRTSGQD
jgi:PAS domain S-box-containing protein